MEFSRGCAPHYQRQVGYVQSTSTNRERERNRERVRSTIGHLGNPCLRRNSARCLHSLLSNIGRKAARWGEKTWSVEGARRSRRLVRSVTVFVVEGSGGVVSWTIYTGSVAGMKANTRSSSVGAALPVVYQSSVHYQVRKDRRGLRRGFQGLLYECCACERPIVVVTVNLVFFRSQETLPVSLSLSLSRLSRIRIRVFARKRRFRRKLEKCCWLIYEREGRRARRRKNGEYGRIERTANGDSLAAAASCPQEQLQHPQHPAGGVRRHPSAERQPIGLPRDQSHRRQRGFQRGSGRDRGRWQRDAAVGLLEEELGGGEQRDEHGHDHDDGRWIADGEFLRAERRIEGWKSAIGRQEKVRETAVQLQRAHHDGHSAKPGEEADPERHLRVHHASFSVLREQQAGLAKLHQAQPLVEQVFRQGSSPLRRPGQRELLDAGSELGGRVHRRDDRQTPQEDDRRVEIATGRVQEKRRPRRPVPIGVRAARLASLAVHASVSASSSRRRLSGCDRRLLHHSRRLSSEFVTRRGCHQLGCHQFTV